VARFEPGAMIAPSRTAFTEEAKAFYLALGFEPSPLEPMTPMVALTDLRKSVA
jgi:hypothetical protein